MDVASFTFDSIQSFDFFSPNAYCQLKNLLVKVEKNLTFLSLPFFNLQSFTKYLKQTLGFMRNSTLWEKFTLLFKEIFTSADQRFISSGGLRTRQLFYEVLRFS